jgi:hypothetical protein
VIRDLDEPAQVHGISDVSPTNAIGSFVKFAKFRRALFTKPGQNLDFGQLAHN